MWFLETQTTETSSATGSTKRYPYVYGSKLWILTNATNSPIQELTSIKASWYADLAWTDSSTSFIPHIRDGDSTAFSWSTLVQLLLNPSSSSSSGWYASCTSVWQILSASSAYPSCDTADIVVCAWTGTGYTISACNVGATTAGTTSASYGNYFQWGRNKWFANGDSSQQSTTIAWTVWLNAGTDTYWFVWNASLTEPWSWANSDITNNWWDTTNTAIARQWPCVNWYHVPAQPEWVAIHSAWWWGTNGVTMQTALKLPYAGNRSRDSGNMYNLGFNGFYWSSSPDGGTYGFDMGYSMIFGSTLIGLSSSKNRANGFSVRCFKN